LRSSSFRVASLTCLSGLVLISAAYPSAHTAEKHQDKVDYAKVDYVFHLYDCVDCHTDGPRAASGLSLTTYEGLMKGGNHGAAIVAGNSANSMLMKIVTKDGAPIHMPPGNSQLKDEYLATLKQWIDEGATDSPYGEALTRYHSAVHDKQWQDALKACDDMEKSKVDGVNTSEMAARNRLPVYAATKDEKGWYATANSLVGKASLNGLILNDIAWTIVDPQGWIKKRDLDLAQTAADLAVQNTRRQSGAILDTLAWVYFQKGDKDKAIATEKEALACQDATGATKQALEDSMKAFGG